MPQSESKVRVENVSPLRIKELSTKSLKREEDY
jgi:hypothetical protein